MFEQREGRVGAVAPRRARRRAAATTDSVLDLQRTAGNTAVSALVAGRDGVTVQRDRSSATEHGITVHPGSRFTAAQIVRMLRASKNVPDFLKKGVSSKGDTIVMSGALDKPEATFSEFLEPFVDALTSADWQITTADSTIESKRAAGGTVTFTQIVTPHLSKRQHLGRSVKTGPGETTFSPDTLFSTEQEVIFGWTVPASSTEQLQTGRGLIVLVTRIAVTNPDGHKKVFTPTADQVLEAVIHEISAHAGRITEGKPDAHGNRAVEDIAKEVAEFFRYSEAKKGIVLSPTAREIFEFAGAAESAP